MPILDRRGLLPGSLGVAAPEHFARFLEEQTAIWTRVVRERNITAH